MYLSGVLSSNLHNSVFLVASRFGIAFGILGNGANAGAYPLLLYALVELYHLLQPQPSRCLFAMAWAVMCVPFILE